MKISEIKALLLFNRITNYTPKQKCVLIERWKTAALVLQCRKEAEALFNKQFKINGSVLDIEGNEKIIEEELHYYRKNEIFIIDIHNSEYPVRLKYIYDPPPVIFAWGNVELLKKECPIGMVGARKASNSSIVAGYSAAKELGQVVEAVVVSGLAAGIDFYAHKGILDGNGFTIAVLGNGIDIVYPRANREMYERIKKRGLLLTEFPLGTPPYKRNFPMRNRIISGLSRGVVVIEAAQTSGALITAQYALEQGREVMAFPGRAGSESFSGNNRLIKEGAYLVENASDILTVLGEDFTAIQRAPETYSLLEQDILNVIGDDRVSLEEIERVLSLPVSRIASTLMMLELKRVVIQSPGKLFTRVCKYE